MKSYFLIPVLALLLPVACTLVPQDNSVRSEFHPPITYQDWKVKHYALQDGAKACALSSGYNGLTIFLSRDAGDKEKLSVQSNRFMQQGSTLVVSVGDKTFEAYESAFSEKTASLLVKQLAKGDKAYLEWSEIAGSRAERVHVQSIVKLDKFSSYLQQCRGM